MKNNKNWTWRELNRTSFLVTIILAIIWLILLILFSPIFGDEGGDRNGGEGGTSSLYEKDTTVGDPTAIDQAQVPAVKQEEVVVKTEPKKQETQPEVNEIPPPQAQSVIEISRYNAIPVEEKEDVKEDVIHKDKQQETPHDRKAQEGNITNPIKGNSRNPLGNVGVDSDSQTGGGNMSSSGSGTGKSSGAETVSNGDAGAGAAGEENIGSGTGKDGEDGPSTGAKFYGMEIKGRKILFILDRSGSMAGSDDGISTRLDILKRELRVMIQKFGSKDNPNKSSGSFKLLFFSDGNYIYPDKDKYFVKMKNKKEITEALDFIDTVNEYGSTMLLEALEKAEELIHSERIDTIYILTDGEPNGEKEIIKELIEKLKNKKINGKKIRLNYIFIGKYDTFLKELAEISRSSPKAPLNFKKVE